MENLDLKVAEFCKAWCDNPQDCEMEICQDKTLQKPNLLFRFTDHAINLDNWYIVELRTFNQKVTVRDIEAFILAIPADRTIKEKVIVSTKGITEDAAILASQHQIWLSHLAASQDNPNRYGYLLARVTRHEIQSSKTLSQAHWQELHRKLEESGFGFMRGTPTTKAEVLDKAGEKICDFTSLQLALPLDSPSEPVSYQYPLPDCYLATTGMERIPIDAIRFHYTTELRAVEGTNRLDALNELLINYIFG